MTIRTRPIKVVVVDDSALMRNLFADILNSQPDIEVSGIAADPYEAREVIKKVNPDVITLDIEMPKMDGLEFLERIMRLRPMPVIMLSSLTQAGADATMRALELGALDCIAKTTSDSVANIEALSAELIAKVRAASTAKLRSPDARQADRAAVHSNVALAFKPERSKRDIIAIGSSTGGVEALMEVLISLPENCPPITITQHMPPKYTESFARRLNGQCRITVKEATNGEKLQPGTAYIAPGGRHLGVDRFGINYSAVVRDGDLVSGHRPSVDVLFDSVAKVASNRAVGVILTGMGSDGSKGLKRMFDVGAYTIGESEETCVVYGMPKAAKIAGGVSVEMPLPQIAGRMLAACYQTEPQV
jgi:two-component system chemotaxis response regulator CheB